MHLMLGIIVAHELEVRITDQDILERQEEWDSLTLRCLCRADYVKGLLSFCGIELLNYHNAVVFRNRSLDCFDVSVRSEYWAERQPR